MTAQRPFLNLGAWIERSRANGPGERYVLWLQGCLLRCPGCCNVEFLPQEPRHLISIDEMAMRIGDIEGIEGVTYTGGEPTLQAQALALLSERLRPGGLTVVCYTGYTLEALRARDDPWIERLLANTDILIDGPYRQEEAASLRWRGSRNQRIHYLTPAYRELADTEGPAEVEFAVGDHDFTTTGTWPAGFLERLQQILAAQKT
jgi:anaerobic ribonucleoside-triphosphate reductase activating protein